MATLCAVVETCGDIPGPPDGGRVGALVLDHFIAWRPVIEELVLVADVRRALMDDQDHLIIGRTWCSQQRGVVRSRLLDR